MGKIENLDNLRLMHFRPELSTSIRLRGQPTLNLSGDFYFSPESYELFARSFSRKPTLNEGAAKMFRDSMKLLFKYSADTPTIDFSGYSPKKRAVIYAHGDSINGVWTIGVDDNHLVPVQHVVEEAEDRGYGLVYICTCNPDKGEVTPKKSSVLHAKGDMGPYEYFTMSLSTPPIQ